MSAVKHLPGPWFVAETDDNEGYPETVIRGMDGIAGIAVAIDFPKLPGTREANAHLLAAAPELLAAAVFAEAALSFMTVKATTKEDRAEFARRLDTVRATIAKATGR